jgi:hypothetical protein
MGQFTNGPQVDLTASAGGREARREAGEAGEPGSVAGDLSERGDAGAGALHHAADLLVRDKAADVRFVERLLEFSWACCGEIQERLRWRGEAQAVPQSRLQPLRVADSEPGASPAIGIEESDIDRVGGSSGEKLPEGGCGPVAQDRVRAGRQQRGGRSGQRRLEHADDVDAAMDASQPAPLHPGRDRVMTEPRL